MGYSLIYKKSIGWCLTGSNLCKWKKTKKDGWSCKWQRSHSHWSRALHGRGLKILGGLYRALFPAPHSHPPTPINSRCKTIWEADLFRPLSLMIAIQHLVMWNKGLQGTLPHDNEVWQGDNISSSGNILKMRRQSVRKARNCKSQNQGWGQISPLGQFHQEPILDSRFMQINLPFQEGCMVGWRGSVDGPSSPCLYS